MKKIVSAALLLITLLAFTACDQTQTSQNPSQSATESSEQTMAATATPTIEITQAPTATVTPTLEITKKPIVTNKPNSDTATRDPNWQSATFPPEVTKADYDFGITYIIDEINALSGPGWSLLGSLAVEKWKNNDGDPSQLEAAIKAIQNMDFRFSEDYDTTRPYDPSNPIACAHKEVTQRVKETIKDYKVYLEDVILSPNSPYYVGHIGRGQIHLIAGDKAAIITVERVIFGCDPVPTPTVKPTPTIGVTPVPDEKHPVREIIIDTSDEYFGWVHEKGAGNPAHLAEAVKRIEAYNSLETAYPSPCDASSWPHYPSKEQQRIVREAVTEHLKNILSDLDVFVYRIVVCGQILADKWDENGNWVPAHVEPHISVIIQLEAGAQQQRATMCLK